jgi:LysM repeat protein
MQANLARALPARGLWVAVLLALTASTARWQPTHAAPARRAAGEVVHLVQPGENLFRIGLQYGVSWIDIMQANHLPNTTIYAGQQLIIPVNGSVSETPPAEPAPAATPPAEPQPPAPADTTYTVQRGDILARIAQRYGVTVSQIAFANNISNPSLIYAGQVLVIPAPGQGSGPGPDPAPAGGGNKVILVDISEQRMYVYQDGALIYNWVVSTGEPGRDTRPGNFSVLNKIPNAYASTWNLWMPNWLGIYWAGYLQNGIHALPILSNGLRLWDGFLGTRVSYGCVILGIWEAQTLYDWVEVGTPVNIQS